VGWYPRRLIFAIVVGFILGIIVGLIVVSIAPSDVQTGLATWFKALGDIFVRLIRIVIPLSIFSTIASGIVSIASVRVLGCFWSTVKPRCSK